MDTIEEMKNPEIMEHTPVPQTAPKKPILRIVFDIAILLMIAALFVLHFMGNKSPDSAQHYVPPTGDPGNGDLVYINMDTIEKYYELYQILKTDIEAESKKQEAVFANRQKALENKAAQFQKNYESGVLTETQIQYTQNQLMQESNQLQQDYELTIGNIQERTMAAHQQVSDSLISASKRVNAKTNASYVVSYQYGSAFLYVDPSKDITDLVLKELNLK